MEQVIDAVQLPQKSCRTYIQKSKLRVYTILYNCSDETFFKKYKFASNLAARSRDRKEKTSLLFCSNVSI